MTHEEILKEEKTENSDIKSWKRFSVVDVFLHSLSHIRQYSMRLHLRIMNEKCFNIQGVPESINFLKKP